MPTEAFRRWHFAEQIQFPRESLSPSLNAMKSTNKSASLVPGSKPVGAKPHGWKRYVYTEAGIVALFIFLVTAHSWYSHTQPDPRLGFVEKRFNFLEPFLGPYYGPIILTFVTGLVVFVAWRQGREK